MRPCKSLWQTLCIFSVFFFKLNFRCFYASQFDTKLVITTTAVKMKCGFGGTRWAPLVKTTFGASGESSTMLFRGIVRQHWRYIESQSRLGCWVLIGEESGQERCTHILHLTYALEAKTYTETHWQSSLINLKNEDWQVWKRRYWK